MKRESKKFTLRPATVHGIDCIYDLRVKSMKPLFEGTLGWNEAKEFEKATDELANAEIVMIGNRRVGVIKVIPGADELHFHQIQILPKYQKGGIGAELMQRAIKYSEISNKPITLFVMKDTPAKVYMNSLVFQ